MILQVPLASDCPPRVEEKDLKQREWLTTPQSTISLQLSALRCRRERGRRGREERRAGKSLRRWFQRVWLKQVCTKKPKERHSELRLDESKKVKLKRKLDEVAVGPANLLYICHHGLGQEKEELKWVESRLSKKRKKGQYHLRRVKFVVLRQLGIITPVAYQRNTYEKKEGTILVAQNGRSQLRRVVVQTLSLVVFRLSVSTIFSCLHTQYINNGRLWHKFCKWVIQTIYLDGN